MKIIAFLKYIKFRYFHPKYIRLGIALFGSTLKTIIFEHKNYFLFCLLLFFVELFTLVNFINLSFSFDYYFLNILQIDDFLISLIQQIYSREYSNLIVLYAMTIVGIAVLLKNFIIFTTTDYTFSVLKRIPTSISKSFKPAIKKFKQILIWSLLELLFYTVAARRSFLSLILQAGWSLITFFIVPLLLLHEDSIIKNILRSLALFEKKITSIMSAEFIFESALYLAGLALVTVYNVSPVYKISLYEIVNLKTTMLSLFILYSSSLIIIAQTILITYLFTKNN